MLEYNRIRWEIDSLSGAVLPEPVSNEPVITMLHKIAAEVFAEFLSNRREEIIREFEAYGTNASDKDGAITELRVMGRFRNRCETMIHLGEIAEGELARNGE